MTSFEVHSPDMALIFVLFQIRILNTALGPIICLSFPLIS